MWLQPAHNHDRPQSALHKEAKRPDRFVTGNAAAWVFPPPAAPGRALRKATTYARQDDGRDPTSPLRCRTIGGLPQILRLSLSLGLCELRSLRLAAQFVGVGLPRPARQAAGSPARGLACLRAASLPFSAWSARGSASVAACARYRNVSDTLGVPARLSPFGPGHSVRQQRHRLICERDRCAPVSVGGIPCSLRGLGAFAETAAWRPESTGTTPIPAIDPWSDAIR
jgi:hypothetical protein